MKPIDAEPLEEILRRRCAQYSNDYGSLAGAISGCLKLVQDQPTIAPPPNDPLTLEELREMGKDWVWIELLVPHCRIEAGYYLKKTQFSDTDKFCCGYPGVVVRDLPYSLYGDTWTAYRRKPGERTT